MYTIKNYIMADSLEQAYELKKKSRNNVIIGGNLWLKMLLIEAGAQTNTVEEMRNAMEPLAELLNDVLQ